MSKVLNIASPGTRWRVHEEEMVIKHLGPIENCVTGDVKKIKDLSGYLPPDTVIYWRLNSDIMMEEEYLDILKQREYLLDFPMINDPVNYLNSHAKEHAFRSWESHGVSCPKCEVIDRMEDITLEYPYLLRLNNEVTGRSSYLIKNDQDLKNNFPLLQADFEESILIKSFTKKIAVEFIDATVEERKYNLSYRIIVSGDKVITGYARLSEASDWVAITGKFTKSMGHDFIKYQARCQKIMTEKEKEIVKAVQALGLNLQGVDVIEDQSENLVFLECQPGFSTGYSNWPRPFYNPHYPELVNFILQNQKDFISKSQLYYYNWLNKENLFEEVFKNLKKKGET